MTIITNNSGTKAVRLTNQSYGIIANYVQIYEGDEQVLQTKTFARMTSAIKWSNKTLGLCK